MRVKGKIILICCVHNTSKETFIKYYDVTVLISILIIFLKMMIHLIEHFNEWFFGYYNVFKEVNSSL